MSHSYIESYKDLYHGTTAEYAAQIVMTQKFTPSIGGWCGPGVYFYDNRSKAWWSASRTCNVERSKGNTNAVPDIVLADIDTLSKSSILDLRSPADLKSFAEFVDRFLLESNFEIKEDISDEERTRIKRALLLSFYCKEKNIKLIIGYFKQKSQTNIDSNKDFADVWQLAIGIETIYCAKDPAIVCNIRRR